MDDKELRRLSRKDLLEILLSQTERIELLEKEVASLEKKLDSKKISINESGTLSEAALKLSKIFESADEAVKIYKQNIETSKKKELEKINDKKLKDLDKFINKKKEEEKIIIKNAKDEARLIVDEAKKEARNIILNASKKKGSKKKRK